MAWSLLKRLEKVPPILSFEVLFMKRMPTFILCPLFFVLLTFSSALADEVNLKVNVPETLSPGQSVSISCTADYSPESDCIEVWDDDSQQFVWVCNDPTAITLAKAMVVIVLPNGRIRGPYIVNLSDVTIQPNTTWTSNPLKSIQLPSNLNTGEGVIFSVMLFGPPHPDDPNPVSNCHGGNFFFSQVQ
jgi:hypothetical protein